MIETIKSYLVSLGFNVDAGSYQAATKAMDSVEQGVAKFAGSAVMNFALAGAAVSAFVVSSSVGIAKFIGDLAQADLANEKLARQLWLSKDAAAAYNNTLKSMGVTLQDLYLSPELMRNFQVLQQQARDLRAPQEFNEQMKMVRSVQFEFVRMKQEATYALQWIGYYFIKYMEGPIKSIKLTLSDINGTITKTMPSWTKVIAQVMSWFARMGITSFRVFKDMIRIFNDLGSAIPRNLKLIGLAIAALGLILQTGPFGIITATLLTMLLLLDDFYTYLDGGESAFGPFWEKLEGFYNKLKGDGAIDEFKQNWKETLESISEGLDEAGEEIKDFYKDLEDKGATKSFEDTFKNTFDIIEKLLSDGKEWVKDLYKELEKQGVLKDLENSFEDVIAAVGELSEAITQVIKDSLGLKETQDLLNGIGKILRDVIVVSLKTTKDLLDSFAGYIKTIAAITRGDAAEKAQKAGEDAQKRLDDRGTNESLWDIMKNLPTKWKDEELSDKVVRAIGLLATRDGNSSQTQAPAYTLPTTNTQNNSNNVSVNQTNNIYGSDPKATATAAGDILNKVLVRNFSGGIR